VDQKSLALVFAGYGAQHQGMLQGLQNLPDVNLELTRLLDAAEGMSELQLSKIAESGPDTLLAEPRVAFPLLFIADYLWARYARGVGLRPHIMAGHDVGEYAALAHAGVLSTTAALDLVIRLSKLLQDGNSDSDGATLVALGLPVDDIRRVLAASVSQELAWISCDNSADQVAIGGVQSALEALMPSLRDAGARQVMLNANRGAFNTPLVAEAASKYRSILENTELRDANIPVIMNATAQAVTQGFVVLEPLAAQVTSTIRWRETMDHIAQMAPVICVESGPGSTLSDLNDTDGGIEYYSLAQSGIIKLLNRL